jgi:hypothetical protein
MKSAVGKFYHSAFLARLFHTTQYCLERELADCSTVLDLGCGPSSPVRYCKNLTRTVGVEAFEPYFRRASEARTHSELIMSPIARLDFPPRSFDAVVLVEVIEHLPEGDAHAILKLACTWARKKVIVTSPNGFIAQAALDGNDLQQHLSGWELAKMRRLGFRSRGLAGLKFLRREVHSGTMGDDILSSIKWHPRALWFSVATLSQLFTYALVPQLAFGLFSVKDVGEGKSVS